MVLTNEDSLRLHVLMGQAQAIRIDEENMTIIGLSANEVYEVVLNCVDNKKKYLKLVRETLSTLALGTPGGYPLFIRRWTRSGSIETDRLEKLLCLGEPEAVIAVAASPLLSAQLAKKVWWCLPTCEVARLMLPNKAVSASETGPKLCDFLLDFLPFEDNSRIIIETVCLLLNSKLLNNKQINQLWRQARGNATYMVGFLNAGYKYLPDLNKNRSAKKITSYKTGHKQLDHLLSLSLSDTGQLYLETCKKSLSIAIDMDTVVDTLSAINKFFDPIQINSSLPRSPADLKSASQKNFDFLDLNLIGICEEDVEDFLQKINAMITLSLVGEPLVAPVFARMDAVGSLMRRKLSSTLAPVFDSLEVLIKKT